MSDGKIPAAWNSVRRLLALGKGNASTRIIIFGTGDHTPHEVQIRSGFRWALLLAAVLLLAGGGHYAWLLVSADPAPLSVIEERDALRRLNRGYALDTERMAGRVESLEVQMRKLAVLAGAPPIATRIGGIGGPVGTAADYDYVSERPGGPVGTGGRAGPAGSRPRAHHAGKEQAARFDPVHLAGARLPLVGLRPPQRSVHRRARMALRAGHLGEYRHSGAGHGRRGGDYTSTSPTYGKYVVVSHGFGVVTRYAHLSRIDVRRSQRLRRNQVVGLVGNTGRSRAPHLHYEVWLNERAQNPLDHIVDYVP